LKRKSPNDITAIKNTDPKVALAFRLGTREQHGCADPEMGKVPV